MDWEFVLGLIVIDKKEGRKKRMFKIKKFKSQEKLIELLEFNKWVI